ncbi:hypothetical protein [Halovivax cerinus]|uniref:Uncharacterized protein n=1 Tax=Halovivax cerinus TaxID=1487865 RepID=A0ABD5NLZ7_9EURY|nr:hypothetical protein [Halovivax cerinus]
MSTVPQSTIDDVTERVWDLLDEATNALPDEAARSDESEPADALSDSGRSTLRALGSDAAALLEDTEPEALLAALDIDRPDGADSIPAAILAGDPDDVASLRALVTLSRLADDEAVGGSFDAEERDATVTLASLLADGPVGEPATAAGHDAAGQSAAGGAPAESESEDETAGDEIIDVLQGALDEVGTGIDDVLGVGGEEDGDGSDDDGSDDDRGEDDGGESGDDGELGDVTAGLVDEAESLSSDTSTGDGEAADDDGETEGGERDDAEGGDEDGGLLDVGGEGLLDGDRSTDGEDSGRTRQSVSGFGRTSHSTIPAGDRPDMTGLARYRTMPDR